MLFLINIKIYIITIEMSIFFLLLFLLNYSICPGDKPFYTPEEIINILNNQIFSEEDLKYIKNNLSSVFEDIYAYFETSKNPPQPNFNKNYHNIIDIKSEINKITSRSKYSLLLDLLKINGKLRDGHIIINFEDYYLKYLILFGILPFKLDIKINSDGKPKMFCLTLEIIGEGKTYFRNYETLFDIIENNSDIPIESINGKDPFDFISNFGSEYQNFRNIHSSFSYKYNLFNSALLLMENPLSIEELTNITISFENGQNFTTDYVFTGIINLNKNFDDKRLLNMNKKDLNKINFYSPDIKTSNNLLDDIINNIYKEYKDEKLKLLDNEKLNWDYNISEIFSCREDKKNEVNVFFIKSFGGKNISLFLNTIQKCGELFDNNTYPVILITNLNKGGEGNISQFLLETLSPLSTLNIYGAIRETDKIVNYFSNMDFINEDYELNEADNCEIFDPKKLKEKKTEVEYGNNIKDKLSQPFIMHGKYFRKKLDDFKSKLKNPRKPTDIIVLTDGFSFSATSLLIKYLQYYGGGITVGFFGNPKEDNIPFDSSQSPSGIYSKETLYKISDGYKQLYKNYKFIMQLPAYQLFFDKNNMEKPLEYDVFPVDERVKYYKYFSDNTYEDFINISKTILKKYKTNCNPENKKLLLITSECDKEFDNKYTHGGYECGTNGIWNKTCVASYCDLGYIFDHIAKKCVVDTCSDLVKKKDKDKNNILLVVILVILAIIILLIVIIFVLHKYKKNENDIDYSGISENVGMNLDEKP